MKERVLKMLEAKANKFRVVNELSSWYWRPFDR